MSYTVLDCRAIDAADRSSWPSGAPVHRVGPRPGKLIDPLLVGRILVVGDDADLAAVGLRLLRPIDSPTSRSGTPPHRPRR